MLTPGVVALSSGQLGGIVSDPSGAAIQNAQVVIQNLATNAMWSAETTEQGSWLASGLPSGAYRITASAQGFNATQLNVSYDSLHPKAYRVALNVGNVSETVTVTGVATMLSTQMSTLTSVDKKPPPQASANVFNFQQRVAGVLPIAVDVPRAGTSYRFVRPLIVNEETKLSFTYKTK